MCVDTLMIRAIDLATCVLTYVHSLAHTHTHTHTHTHAHTHTHTLHIHTHYRTHFQPVVCLIYRSSSLGWQSDQCWHHYCKCSFVFTIYCIYVIRGTTRFLTLGNIPRAKCCGQIYSNRAVTQKMIVIFDLWITSSL